MNDKTVLLDLDAYVSNEEELPVIKAEKTFGFDLQVGETTPEIWMGLEKEAKKMTKNKDSMGLKDLTKSLTKQCLMVLQPYNNKLEESHFSKLNFEQIKSLYTTLMQTIEKHFLGRGLGKAQEKKNMDTKELD